MGGGLVEIRLLGRLEVVVDGDPVVLPRGRARSLLALLALHPRQVMSTDRLVDELWGGEPPRTAVTALQGLVSTLRKRLEPGRAAADPPTVLLTHEPGYVLAIDRDQVDAHRLRRLVEEAADAPPPERASRLRTALALWRGPPLADFTYEPFAQTPIASLAEVQVTALEARIDADLALGHHAEVVAELEELVAAHPLREGLRAHLMLALYRCGRQGEALEVYRAAHRELADELGLEPGPRLRALEQAILRQNPSLDLHEPVPVGGPPESSDGDAAWLGASRRTVTVVFADLSLAGPSAPGGGADPEVVRPVLASGYTKTREVVQRHGGTVEGIVGDVAVAVFGLPVAHEDDPLRAVRAAAALRDDLADLDAAVQRDHGVHLAARVGIATGEIVVGDPTAASTSGPPVGRASRLQQAARHGEVLLADTTRRLVQGAAVVEPVDDPSGVAADGPVWRLVEVAAEPAPPATAGTSFVGRDEELARLRAALERAARERRAGLVTVVGEAGVGKSRLGQAFTDSVAGQARVAIGHCRSYGEGITFWPLRELVLDLTDHAGRAGLERLLDGEPHGRSNAAQLAAATSLTDEPLRRPGDLFAAVRHLVEVGARAAPLVVVVEDVHWAQPTLLELLEYLARSVRARVLLLCLTRPDLYDTRPRWAAELPAAVTVELAPLGAAESRQLVADRLGARLPPRGAIDRILAMAQGNPLFLEQLLATVGEDQEVAVPPSVQALLMARLDRLGPAERDLLRCASVIGVEVPLDALAAIVPDGTRPHLHRHLLALEDKQLTRRVDGSGQPRFEFRHVLIQQAAYHSLTHAARAELHERLATWLETEAAAAPPEVGELVGLHLERAVRHRRDLGRTDATTDRLAVQAGERLAGAGLRAYARFDVPAAENLLSRARALLPGGHPQRPAVLRRLTEAYPVMGRPDEAAACFEELLALVGPRHDDIASRSVRLEQIRFRLITGPDPIPMATIQREVEESLEAFQQAGDSVLVSQAHYVLAFVHLRAGRMDALAEVAWRGMERARRAGELRERLGAPWWVVMHLLEGPTPVSECLRICDEVLDVGELHHLGVLAALGHFRAMAGDIDEGRALIGRARDLLRERIRLPRPHSFIGQQRAAVEVLAGDLQAATAALEEALEVATRITERDEVAHIAARLSLLRSRQGQANEATRLARLSSEQAPAESVVAQALARTAEARAMIDRGEADRAGRLVRQAVTSLPQDMLPLQALVHETLADVLQRAGREEDAQTAVDRAVALHQQKGSVMGARAAASPPR